MRFKRRSDKEQRPTAFYQPPVDGEAATDAQTGDGGPSATPASAKRNGAEKPRRNGKLLRPLWWSLPIVVVALAVGIYMTVLPLWAWNTGRSARAGNNEGALKSYSRQIYWGDLGPASWVAHYNAGTQHVKLDHPDEAVAELRIAWDRVPKAKQIEDGRIETYSYECTVRMNLALALEKQGDAAMSTDRARAAEIYKEMGEVVARVSPRLRLRISRTRISRVAVAAPMPTRLMIVLSKSSSRLRSRKIRTRTRTNRIRIRTSRTKTKISKTKTTRIKTNKTRISRIRIRIRTNRTKTSPRILIRERPKSNARSVKRCKSVRSKPIARSAKTKIANAEPVVLAPGNSSVI